MRLAEALKREAEALKRESEALEQQTATAAILHVISSSPTDVQPVFDAIVRTAARLSEADYGFLARYDGTSMAIVAHSGATDEEIEAVLRVYPMAPTPDSLGGRTILEGAVVHIPDVRSDPTYGPRVIRDAGWRTALGVPLLREGAAIGLLGMWRRAVCPFSDRHIELLKIFADQAVIAIENVRLFTELQEKNEALTQAHAQVTEALEQQTATSEILRVISSSPTDLQPVLDAVAQKAAHICSATDATIRLLEGDTLRLVARFGSIPLGAPDVIPRSREYPSGRAVIERRTIHIDDVLPLRESEFPAISTDQRTVLATPLLREGLPIGVILIRRVEVLPFTDKQVALLQTFADQAVIAIENVRLFNETKEALEQQTATSEILRVIASSPTDVRPVFEEILKRAATLCEAQLGHLWLYEGGEQFRLGAGYGSRPDHLQWLQQGLHRFGRPFFRESGPWRVGQVLDVRDTEPYRRGEPVWIRTADHEGMRTLLAVPLVKDGRLVGSIAVYRREVQPFTDQQTALVQTFADQAVIAIENVRLFRELEARTEALGEVNTELSDALEQQTVTSEVLKVISRSTFELEPVLGTLIENATKLCDAAHGLIYRFDGEVFHVGAFYGASAQLRQFWESQERRPGRGSCVARVGLEHRTVQIPDVLADAEYEESDFQKISGFRTMLGVPMLREGELVGAIVLWRTEVREFTGRQIELVTTFADQAVIAIENVRLLQELRSRTSELARSVEELRALGEVGQAVNSTLDLETVLNTIVTRAVRLSNAKGGVIYEYDEGTQRFDRISGAYGLDDDLRAVLSATPLRLGEGAAGQAAAQQAPVQVADVLAEGTYDVTRVRAIFEQRGYRSLLAVPLLFERQIVGVLVVWGSEPASFAQELVDLLQTLATQSVLAIQNARLFREIADKSRQLEVASQHKSEFLASMSHELRTPLNAILGFNEMILGQIYGEVPPGLHEPLADIQSSGKHLLRLINNVLDLSKIEAGRMELALADYSVQDTVGSVRVSLRSLAEERGLEFVASVPEDIPLAYGDGGRIVQCLTNLAGNALKFTRQGRVEITVELRGDRLVYRVADTGIGIAADKIDSLFVEFRQTDATIAREFGGTGLGLSITKKFVELHGGRIWIESELGRGSTFFIEIPLRLDGGTKA